MFTTYDAQFLFQQYGVKFIRNGVQWDTKHPSTFVWSTRGLNLPITNLWFNENGKIKNMNAMPRKWRAKLRKLAPPENLRVVISTKKEFSNFNAPLLKKVKKIVKGKTVLSSLPKN